MRPVWRKSVLYGAVIGIEGCWLYAMMALLNRQAAADSLSITGILALYLVALGLHSLLRRPGWHSIFIRIINWLGWAVGMLLVLKLQLYSGLAWSDTTWLMAIPRAFIDIIYTFRPELLILVSSGVIWWMGRRLAYTRVGFNTLVSEFQFGLLLLLITFFSASMMEVSLDNALLLAVVFFLISLLGISTAHALENTTWLSGLYRGRWSGLLMASVIIILIVSFIISLLVTPELLRAVAAAIKWAYELAMEGLFLVGGWIASLMPDVEPTDIPPLVPPMPAPEEAASSGGMSETVRDILRLVWTVMLAGLLLLALWRLTSAMYVWLRRRMAAVSGVEFEAMPGAFRADLLALLRRILKRLLGLRRLFHREVKTAPSPTEITTVRQIYRQFLKWAAEAGFPRGTSQTPYEYQYELAGRLVEVQNDLNLITRQYVRTRYGTQPVTENELQQLKQSWYNIRESSLDFNATQGNNIRKTGGDIRWWI